MIGIMNSFLQDLGELDKLKVTVLSCDYSGYDNPFLGQHGVAFLIEAVSKDCSKRILLDAGQSEVPILYNMNILNIDPESIDMIVLSHCHFDHTGGLKGMLDKIICLNLV
jgi:7,8-dihydropterin-6-yl-methyl-4-(beta-D-ribofuranosyl)aminobenzene 5'-phosphate synthase